MTDEIPTLNKTKAARLLDVDRKTFNRWLEAGHLPASDNDLWTEAQLREAVAKLPPKGERGLDKVKAKAAAAGSETPPPSPAPKAAPAKGPSRLNLPKDAPKKKPDDEKKPEGGNPPGGHQSQTESPPSGSSEEKPKTVRRGFGFFQWEEPA